MPVRTSIGILSRKAVHKIRTAWRRQNSGARYNTIPRQPYVSAEGLRFVFTSGLSLRYNGGTKIYNLWTKLLRSHGYEAYIATLDGAYDRWLVSHQPVISYDEVNRFLKEGCEVRIVTSWLDVPQFERILGDRQFYYFDAELAWTCRYRKNLDAFLRRKRIAQIATHSRYIQSWYMAEYGIKPILINEWTDKEIFYPDPEKRVIGRIGCMVDQETEREDFQFLTRKSGQSKMCESLILISGDEQSVAETMRSVDIFVGLNQGKDALWGEGCPRTQQEAMHCGCALVAYDVLGNREYLYDGWTGLIVQPGDRESLWAAVEFLLEHSVEKERLRANGARLANALFAEIGKYELISGFVRLQGMLKEDLEAIFPKPFWLAVKEVPYLARCAANARGTIVEIGCAYGGSSTVFLLNKAPAVQLFSIDAFVVDSKGGFSANEGDCRRAVARALGRQGQSEAMRDWHLIGGFSHEVVGRWNRPIDLLFIDGSHQHEDVKRDFELWSRFVTADGTILLHDSRKDNLAEDPQDEVFSRGWAGPSILANELKATSEFEEVDQCYSITAFKRKQHEG